MSACVAVLVLTGARLPAVAQPQAAAPFLLELRGDPVTVRYTPGSLDRAAHVQRRFVLLTKDFWDWAGGRTGLDVYLLSQEEWRDMGLTSPYGMADRLGRQQLALPAWGDAGTVELWRRLLPSGLPSLEAHPIRGTPEEAASLILSDLLGEVEAARLLLEATGYSGSEPWIGEVMAHAAALAAVLRHEPERIAEIGGLFNALSLAAGGPGAHPLAGAAAPASTRLALWYQARYFEAATIVSAADGKECAKKLLKRARKHGGVLPASELYDRYPDLLAWRDHAFAPGP